MKLKNEQEIKTLSKKSWDEWKSEDGFELDGDYYQDAQRLHYTSPGPDRWKIRSTTFQGIADAMAEQWGQLAQ